MYKFLILVALLVGQTNSQEETYAGFAVFKAIPATRYQVTGLRALVYDEPNDEIEFWREPNDVNDPAYVMVSPERREYLVTKLAAIRIPYELIIQDIDGAIEETSAKSQHKKISHRMKRNAYTNYSESDEFYRYFRDHDMIESKLTELAQNPKVSLEVAGLSYEKRKLYLMKISTDPEARKPVIFIDAGHHAREWITHSTLIYMMESLLSDSMPIGRPEKQDAAFNRSAYRDFKSHLDKYDFWFVPVVNPDGYEYSHVHKRLWRKTRSSRSIRCAGIDANRNYPTHWGVVGSSTDPCDDSYGGPEPLSEPETKTMANILSSNRDRIKMYLSLHSFGQYLLAPPCYAKIYPENYAELETVAQAGVKALAEVRGTKYKFGTSAMLVKPVGGTAQDYAYFEANISLAYSMELPDTGARGFLLYPQEIIPIGHETTIGLSAMIHAIQ